MGKNAAYAAQYAEEAKEQMRMYGIPASVILAQAILETEPTVARMQQPLWHQGYGIVVEEWRRVWSLYG